MSTYYLASIFSDKITDIVAPTDGIPEVGVTGSYVIRVPDSVPVRNPQDVPDLLAQKYAGILGSFGLFTQVLYDDMLDSSEVNRAASSKVILGTKGSTGIYPGGRLQSTSSVLSWPGPGYGPSQAILTWEVFEYVDRDPASEPFQRMYREISTGAGALQAQVSFDGGTSFVTAMDRALITIPLGQQGADVVVRFNHTGSPFGRVFVGSWALLF